MTWVLTAVLVGLLLLAVGVVVLCDISDWRRRNHTHPTDCTCPFHRLEVFR